MDFTRQPIIESIITAKEGCKLVVRSSKGAGQEEYFVDAVEVVSFGHALFFRSLEKPKSFLTPASDYEVLEVREARMVLKHVGADRNTIRIGGGRDATSRPAKEVEKAPVQEENDLATPVDSRLEKRRDRRRSVRRRRGQEGAVAEGDSIIEDADAQSTVQHSAEAGAHQNEEAAKPEGTENKRSPRRNNRALPVDMSNPMLTSLLPPPPTLISETIDRYKENELFRGAFFTKNEDKAQESSQEKLGHPGYEVSEEEEEQIYQQRLRSIEEEAEEQRRFAKAQQALPEESWEVPVIAAPVVEIEESVAAASVVQESTSEEEDTKEVLPASQEESEPTNHFPS